MMNPVMEALLLTRAGERLQALHYDPPASWTKEAKLAFLHLQPEIQIYYVAREKERDRAVRQAQREAAEIRKQLAEVRKELAALKQSKETENGTTQQDA